MADINITIAPKVFINFTPLNVEMIRGELNTVPVTISYTLGTGQTLTPGTVLNFSTSGQANFTQLTFTSGATFNGTGTVNAILASTPGVSVIDQPITFTIDGSTLTVNIDYNSRPTVEDIDLSLLFGATKTFTLTDFADVNQGHYQDFDGDSLAAVMITGNTTDFFYPNSSTPLSSNTWIPVGNIVSGQLTFKGNTSQISGYSRSEPYKVRDSHGVESIV